MAYNPSTESLHTVLSIVDSTLIGIQSLVQGMRNNSASGDTDRVTYRTLQNKLAKARDRLNIAALVSGIDAYVLEQKGIPNASAEWIANANAADTLRDWIHVNFPTHNPSGGSLEYVYNADGERSDLTFTSAQTAGFRTAADTFLATIG